MLSTEESFIPSGKHRFNLEVAKFTALNETLKLSPSLLYFSLGFFDDVWFTFVRGDVCCGSSAR